jgi:hypothetical protein
MEKGMDRNLRLANIRSTGWRPWIRAIGLGLAVAATGLALGTAAPAPAVAQVSGTSMSVPLAADAPSQYVVKKGDTLWDIAGVFLRDPWYWPEIWYVNPQVANPHLIYPGDVLNLVYVDGKPRITLERAGEMRLSPQVRSEPLTGAIRTIPYDLLMDFVGRPGLLTKDQARKGPYVVGMRDRHIIGSDQNEVYGRGLEDPAPGSRFNVINVGDELRDPDDGDLLGYIGHYAGTGVVIQNTGAVIPGESSIFRMQREEELAHLRVVESGREILPGDRLFPAEVDIGDDFKLAAPKNQELLGQVIAVVDGVYVAGKYQVVAINRGAQHGLEPGNVLGVFYRGEEVRDRFQRMDWTSFTANYSRVRLPDERSATVLVFAVHDRLSYALVVESTQVIRRGDFVAHPLFGHKDAGMRDFMR